MREAQRPGETGLYRRPARPNMELEERSEDGKDGAKKPRRGPTQNEGGRIALGMLLRAKYWCEDYGGG